MLSNCFRFVFLFNQYNRMICIFYLTTELKKIILKNTFANISNHLPRFTVYSNCVIFTQPELCQTSAKLSGLAQFRWWCQEPGVVPDRRIKFIIASLFTIQRHCLRARQQLQLGNDCDAKFCFVSLFRCCSSRVLMLVGCF